MALHVIRDAAGVAAAVRALERAPRISYDLETTGLDPRRDAVLLAQFADDAGECYVVVCRHADARPLVDLLADRRRLTLAHNAKFEYQFTLAKWGVRLARVYDSMLAEMVLTAGLDALSPGLGDTALRRLGLSLDKSLQKSFADADPATFDPTAEQLAYAAEDALILPALRTAQIAALKAEGLVKTAALEFDVLPVFAEMEYYGFRLNLDRHAEALKPFAEDAEHYGIMAASILDEYWQVVASRQREADEAQYAGLTARLDELLAPYGGRLSKDTPADVRAEVEDVRKDRAKRKPKTPAPLKLTQRDCVLAALAEAGIALPNIQAETVAAHADKHPALGAYAKWAKAQKIVSTYGDNLRAKVDDGGRVHTSYTQMVSSGRVSSADPNVQNMPPAIRACFEPAPGNVLVVADFANMEFRIAVGLFNDAAGIEAFAAGVDLHCLTAANAWPERFKSWKDVPKDSQERKDAKIANFASIYGATKYALMALGLSEEVAERLLAGIAATYVQMWAGVNAAGEDALHTGYAITALGRKRYFPKLPPQPRGWQAAKDWRKLQGGIRRAAMNHPVQGTGADIAKRALRLIYDRLYVKVDAGRAVRPAGRIVNVVHDEIVVETPRANAERVSELVSAAMLKAGAELIAGVEIPADVHVTERWEK